ncbi:MAG: glycerophosphodiester phosphodiesterase family protein [Hyphomicrobiaceae bacterium]
MFDRSAFVRPIAHRGLHNPAKGLIENTGPAFDAAIAGDFGIECDLRPAADGTPMVFHDLPLGRLIDTRGKISDFKPADLARLTYTGTDTRILTFSDFLDVVAGQVPLLVEVKSEWAPPDAAFMKAIAKQAKRYKGPIALMSFDPAVMTALKLLVPKVPRGIVSGIYKGDGWWLDTLDPERAFRLTNLIDSGPAEPHFFAYHVKALPTPVTRFLREGLQLPLFTWTVRTEADLATAAEWADAPIFEGIEP